MFRPLRLLGRNAVKIVTINSHRSKIIFPESFLDKAERMKLWHSENKQLFGSIIREKKANQKDKRKKASKSPKELTLNDVSISTHVRISQMSQKISKNDMNTKENQNIGSDKNMFIDSAMKKINLSDSSVTNNAKYAAMRPDKKHQIEIISPNVKNGILSASNHTVPSVIIRNLRLFPMMNNQKAYVADSNSDDATEEKILQVRSSKVEHQKFPSVSKILDQTMSPESRAALEKWKKEKIEELGLAEFEKFYRAQLDAGSRFHGLLSKHLLSPQDYVSADTDIQGVWTSVGPVLKNIKNPKAVESHVVHPVLKYKGIIDCVAVYQDKPTLIEWKKSDKPKQTLSATYDNPVQLAAYFGAISHDPNYKGLNVRDALLVIAYTDGSPADTFHLSMDQMRQHWAAWLTRLEKFVAAEKETEAAKTIEDSNDKSVS